MSDAPLGIDTNKDIFPIREYYRNRNTENEIRADNILVISENSNDLLLDFLTEGIYAFAIERNAGNPFLASGIRQRQDLDLTCDNIFVFI